MQNILLVGIGGFVGSVCRYLVNGLVLTSAPYAFPFGTLVVNVVGCSLIGLFHGVTDVREIAKSELRLLLVVGLLGGFTTFSAFGHDTLELVRTARYASAFANVVAQVVLGLFAVAAGHWVGRAV